MDLRWTGTLIFIAWLTAIAGTSQAQIFTINDTGGALVVEERGEPVLAYNYRPTKPPEGVDPERWSRSTYIQPVFGPNGESMTEDYPSDHYHHRGIFWAWPRIMVDDTVLDTWSLENAEQVFEQWNGIRATDDKAVIDVQNAWVAKATGRAHVVERVRITVWPSERQDRNVDFTINLSNVSDGPLRLLGQTDKGYGGFNIRPNTEHKPLTFTTESGVLESDSLTISSRWADVSFKVPRSSRYMGMTVFRHPDNPGYPNMKWILRHYGLVGASWPHLEGYELAPGEDVTLKYRVFLHTGHGEDIGLGQIYQLYLQDLAAEEE